MLVLLDKNIVEMQLTVETQLKRRNSRSRLQMQNCVTTADCSHP